MGLVDVGQVRRFAEERYAEAELFSAEEKVAERVLGLLNAGHNVESVRAWLLADRERMEQEEDEEQVAATSAFLAFLDGGS